MKTPKTLVALLATAAVLATAGCAGSSGADSSSGDKLVLWHAFAGQEDKVEFIDWALDEFQKENPDITLDVTALEQNAYKTKLQSAMATGGDVPDVFYSLPGGYLKTFVDAGRVADLTAALDTDNWRAELVPAALDAVTYDGKVYAIPQSIDTTVMWYNTKLFKEHGWKVPTTWDEFISLRDQIAKEGIVPVAMGNKASWPSTFWFQYLMLREGGPGAIDGFLQGDANSSLGDAGVKALDTMQQLAADKTFPEGFNGISDQEANLLFLNGQAAMVLNGTWQLGMTADAPDTFEMGYFPFPEVNTSVDSTDIVAGVTSTFAMSENAKDNPAAVTFLRFISSKPVSEKFATIRQALTATEGATNENTVEPLLAGLMKDIVTPAGALDPFFDTAMPPQAMQVYYTTMQGVLDGSIDPKAGATALEAALAANK
jgi:raffinose/stachyose/melibiose transport system substrate-binding protein